MYLINICNLNYNKKTNILQLFKDIPINKNSFRKKGNIIVSFNVLFKKFFSRFSNCPCSYFIIIIIIKKTRMKIFIAKIKHLK